MLNSFKAIELIRYYISSNVEKAIKDNAKRNGENSEQTACTVFSTGFSLLAAFVSTELSKEICLSLRCIMIFAIFLIGYVVFYSGYLFTYRKIKRWIIARKAEPEGISESERKQAIDDFDHIACDSTIFAKLFITQYESISDEKIKEFYYYEILYYLKKATQLTDRLFDYSSKCINNIESNAAIAVYRIENISEMMTEILEFINEHKKEYCNKQKGTTIKMMVSDIDNANNAVKMIEERIKRLNI